MSESTPAPAAVNSEQPANVTPQLAPAPKPEPGSVPYARFQEVVEQRKGLETTLNSMIDGMMQDLPEDMRDLVPNLPPAEKAAWVRTARERGLFSKPEVVPASSPDAKRPGGKHPIDLTGLSPLQKMQAGYSQQ
jgi:hypothetical protein